MSSHPINEVTSNIMEKLTEMTDVNTVIGDAITTPSGVVIIPISKVSVGFGVGGGEYNMNTAVSSQPDAKIPFGGGGGAALTINPIAFLTVSGENVKILTVDRDESTIDKALSMLPELVDKAVAAYNERKAKKNTAESPKDAE
ncbi:putative spore protein YtfJ [bioreactor metagenome]|uniref:Putative spore protein YtfJ n=1 Tax=bioreactor metagenome TaxID=1076179 RepID=A0A644Z5F4_9ZZZZ